MKVFIVVRRCCPPNAECTRVAAKAFSTLERAIKEARGCEVIEVDLDDPSATVTPPLSW